MKIKKYCKAIQILFVLYLVVILLLKWVRPGQVGLQGLLDMGLQPYDWNPLADAYTWQIHWTTYVCNALMFVPAGVLGAYVMKKKSVGIFIGLAVCFAVELVQPILKVGVFDLTTVLFAFAGYLLGIAMLMIFKKVRWL